MIARIHPLSLIDPAAQIADDAEIGPYCVVGPDVTVGSECHLVSHVHVSGWTSIGARTVVHPFVSLGGPPQSIGYRGGRTRLIIGADCKIREGVTISTGTEDGGGVTQVGDYCFLMAGSHVAHDCTVGSHVIFANNAVLGGHVHVGDHVVLGGQAAVRQHLRVGEGVMVVGLSGVRADVVPFGLASGPLAHLAGLNAVGLRRRGVSREQMRNLRRGYRALFHAAGAFRDRVDRVAADFPEDPLIARVIAFIREGGHRPLTMPALRMDGREPSESAA